MAIKAKEKSGVGIRLILAAAACVVLFVAQPTTPIAEDQCGASEYGTIHIENRSEWPVIVEFSGQSIFKTTVYASESVSAQVGGYIWTAKTTWAEVHFAVSGSVVVKKNKTSGIVINKEDLVRFDQ